MSRWVCLSVSLCDRTRVCPSKLSSVILCVCVVVSAFV